MKGRNSDSDVGIEGIKRPWFVPATAQYVAKTAISIPILGAGILYIDAPPC
jgi:hypothetical protein